jgi:hypothetical protein
LGTLRSLHSIGASRDCDDAFRLMKQLQDSVAKEEEIWVEKDFDLFLDF